MVRRRDPGLACRLGTQGVSHELLEGIDRRTIELTSRCRRRLASLLPVRASRPAFLACYPLLAGCSPSPWGAACPGRHCRAPGGFGRRRRPGSCNGSGTPRRGRRGCVPSRNDRSSRCMSSAVIDQGSLDCLRANRNAARSPGGKDDQSPLANRRVRSSSANLSRPATASSISQWPIQ